MKKKSRKKEKINYLIIFSVIIVVFSLGFLFVKFAKKEENQIIKKANKYEIKIDYPILKNKNIENEIREKIDLYKEEFIKSTKEISNKEVKYEFTSTYSVKEFGDIDSVHVTTYLFTGGNHYYRYDDTIHYNVKTGEKINMNYFLKDENAYEKLKVKAYNHIIKYLKENNFVYTDEHITEGLKKENVFQNFSFSNNGLTVIFPPLSIAASYIGEITITIPYTELYNILKPEYVIEQKNELGLKIPIPRDLSKFEGKKLIAFTFDDGPSANTSLLLDNLERLDARVTFFVLGSRVERYKENLIRSYEMGNQIGSHSYSHANLSKLDDAALSKEINDTKDTIKSIIGVEPKVIRPPYGSINKKINEITDNDIILWNVDTLDWKYKDKNRVKEEIIKNANDGAIILLHDLYKTSVEGAILAMEELKQQGYAFVTIEEMKEIKKVTESENKVYFDFL